MLLRTLLATAAMALASAATAHADSIVFVKDANVWVASPDGSNQRPLTTDGTSDAPYRSPSQADDGTVAASFKDGIRVLRRSGAVAREIDPPPLTDSVSHLMDGTPVDVAISPDGQRIAYTFSAASCPPAASCGARAATGYVSATGDPLPGNVYLSNPSWVNNSRTLVFGGYLHQVNVHDIGAAEDVHWFDDEDVVGQSQSTDLGDGELSRAGDRLALVRGYSDDTHIIWYTLTGPPPAVPAMQCATGKLEGLHGPTWAPDGESLAWGEPDGVWIKAGALDCAVQPALVIPGASEPDWGPADAGSAASPALKLKVARASLRRVAAKGLKVTVPCATACIVDGRLTLKGRKLGAKRVVREAAGAATLTLKPRAKAARRLKRMRSAKLTVRVVVTLADGTATTLTKAVRVSR
jgi:hypothetical protein